MPFNMKLLIVVALLGIATLPPLRGQSVTVTAKAPLETLSDDGSVNGVVMSAVGTKYMLVKLGDNSRVILKDATGHQYRITITDTDYTPPAPPAISTT